MTTGERIKELRLNKRMSLQELGDNINIGASTIRKWEEGLIASIGYDKLERVAKYFGVSSSYLINGDTQNNNVTTNNGIVGHTHAPVTIQNNSNNVSKEEAELLRIYNALSIKNRAKLINTAYELEESEQ